MPTFYSTHPGFAGAMTPIPAPVKAVADELNGQTMSLKEAVNKIKAVTNAKVEVVDKYKYISLTVESGGFVHFFNVISYR